MRGVRWGWLVIGVVLVAGGVALGVAAVLAFTRVPDAELGDTRDLALGFLLALLALATLGGAIASIAAARPRGAAPSAAGDGPDS